LYISTNLIIFTWDSYGTLMFISTGVARCGLTLNEILAPPRTAISPLALIMHNSYLVQCMRIQRPDGVSKLAILDKAMNNPHGSGVRVHHSKSKSCVLLRVRDDSYLLPHTLLRL
jgi:hypothetical protein